MFLVITTYVVAMAMVEPQRAKHVEWVDKYVKNGTFIVAGPRRGHTGGVIIAKTMDKDKLMKILAEDSFIATNLVETNVVDFDPMFTPEDLKDLRSR